MDEIQQSKEIKFLQNVALFQIIINVLLIPLLVYETFYTQKGPFGIVDYIFGIPILVVCGLAIFAATLTLFRKPLARFIEQCLIFMLVLFCSPLLPGILLMAFGMEPLGLAVIGALILEIIPMFIIQRKKYMWQFGEMAHEKLVRTLTLITLIILPIVTFIGIMQLEMNSDRGNRPTANDTSLRVKAHTLQAGLEANYARTREYPKTSLTTYTQIKDRLGDTITENEEVSMDEDSRFCYYSKDGQNYTLKVKMMNVKDVSWQINCADEEVEDYSTN